MADEGDSQIIRRVLAGETDAFEMLVLRHKEGVFKTVGRRVPPQDMEDVAQETFVRAFRSLASFKAEGALVAWLHAIAVKTCYDFWRKHYRRGEQTVDPLDPEAKVWAEQSRVAGSGGETGPVPEEAERLLRWALGRLSPENRAVVELLYLEEKSMKETADILGWSLANVKIRSFRARRRLREILSSAWKEPES